MEEWQQGHHLQRTTVSRRRFLQYGSAGLLVSSLLAGCSIQSEQTRFTVTIPESDATHFTPGRLAIRRGATVVWQNQDTAFHTVTCNPTLAQQEGSYSELPEGAKPWDSGVLTTGQTWSYTFTMPGRYIYYSRYDSVGRMLGTILVS